MMAQETAIATPRESLTRKNRYVIAKVLSWDAQRQIDPDEIETIAINQDILWVRLTKNRAIPIAVSTFKNIRRQQLEQMARLEAERDIANVLEQSDRNFTFQRSEHLQPSSEHYAANPEHYGSSSDHSGNSSDGLQRISDDYERDGIEIDSDEKPNPVYRVWKSFNLLGTFYKSPVDGLWIAMPTYGRDYDRHNTSDKALAAIVNAWNHANAVRSAEVLKAS